jgi:hypothetical protein
VRRRRWRLRWWRRKGCEEVAGLAGRGGGRGRARVWGAWTEGEGTEAGREGTGSGDRRRGVSGCRRGRPSPAAAAAETLTRHRSVDRAWPSEVSRKRERQIFLFPLSLLFILDFLVFHI